MRAILGAIFLWSSLPLVIRLSGLQVHELIFFSCAISSSVIGTAFLLRRFRARLPGGKALASLIVLGPLSLVNSFSFFYAYKNTSVANAVLTHYTAPVLVAFLAPAFLKERLTWRILAAVAVASAGLWIMLGISVSQFIDLAAAGDRNTGGILAGLLSGFAYAVLVILFRIFAQNFSPVLMTFSQNIVIALLLLPFVDIQRGLSVAPWAIVVMGLVHSTMAPVLYFKGMKEVTANRAAILGYLEPLCAIFLSMVFLGEGMNYRTITGGAMIVFSGYLTMKGDGASRTPLPSL
jgi:drug/metabolite transporter (DMT)-like permease